MQQFFMVLIVIGLFFKSGYSFGKYEVVRYQTMTGDQVFSLKLGDALSERYHLGAHLIYDCKDLHWACVDERDYGSCQKVFVAQKRLKAKRFSCFPVRQFKEFQECEKAQQKAVTEGFDNTFCFPEKNF